MRLKNHFILITLFLLNFGLDAVAVYQQPPKEILEVMRAPSPFRPVMSPRADRLILVSTQGDSSIERVARPFLRLAGVRLEPQNRSRHDTPGGYGIPSCAQNLILVNVADGAKKEIDISKLACAGSPAWSADGRYFFIRNTAPTNVELWIGDGKTGKIGRVAGLKLNPMFGGDIQWLPDQKSILVKMLPRNQIKVPQEKDSLVGPSVQESIGKSGLSSTYEKRDTLTNKQDELFFEYYGLSQLAIVDAASKTVKPIGQPAVFDRLKMAPDGRHLLVTEIVKPYSYLVTYERFPKKVYIWDIVKQSKNLVAELPLADRVPIHGVPVGPRGFFWNPHDPATLIWAEALDGGDWAVKVPARDKIMKTAEPFTKGPTELFQTEMRFSGLMWFEQRQSALMYEYDHNRQWIRVNIINPDNPKQPKRLLWDYSSKEEYGNPGDPVGKVLRNGFDVIRQSQNSIFLEGEGASPKGARPFLDRLDLNTLKTERLFRCGQDEYENFIAFTGETENQFLTWYQTQVDFPNAYLRKLGASISAAPGEAVYASSREALTQLPNPVPQIAQIKKRLVKYKRADGLDLSFILYIPPGYKEGTRLPTILSAYPLDYADPSMAGQVSGSQDTYTRLVSYRLLLLAGYAVIDAAAFPIVGDPQKAYDTYMDQLVADAKAAVAEAVKTGVVDPDRIGVTGHSHGALMTVNLLAHSDLFRAGVATSGSYNKTLTPFGFQNERRSVWEAPEVYQKVSPFFYADKLKTPLVIIHGMDDANPGTTPIQANFMYDAIRGNGGTVRLVMLPHEPHWYTARESNEQVVYEMLSWFDRYVKNAPIKTSK